MTSASIFLALAALIVGGAKVLSFWNGRKTERLKNAEEQNEQSTEAKEISNRVTADSKFRNGVRDFFSSK